MGITVDSDGSSHLQATKPCDCKVPRAKLEKILEAIQHHLKEGEAQDLLELAHLSDVEHVSDVMTALRHLEEKHEFVSNL